MDARVPRDAAGIYFVQEPSTGLIKIGFSCAVFRRLPELESDSSEPLLLLAITPGTLSDEAALHARFHLFCNVTRREWFAPSPALLRHIAAVQKLTAAHAPPAPRLPRSLAARFGNRGARALSTAIQDKGLTHRGAGKQLGVTGAAVGFWTVGAKKPSAPCRIRILEHLGIPLSAWDESDMPPPAIPPAGDLASRTG